MTARIFRESPTFHANRMARPASRPAGPGTAYTSHHRTQQSLRHQKDGRWTRGRSAADPVIHTRNPPWRPNPPVTGAPEAASQLRR
jgi:hypothetical protein